MLEINRIHQGDVLELSGRVPEASVHCVVTSPPYWGLRSYGQDGEWGAEKTPDAYVERMVEWGRAMRRVLRDDGTLWLNLGDTYAGGGNGGGGSFAQDGIRCALPGTDKNRAFRYGARGAVNGLKPKDLVGIPWRVALALQADGWWLRSAIVWPKPNGMPSSVTDRPPNAYEFIFLMTKAARYFYDGEAVKEACASGPSDLQKMVEGKARIGGKHKTLIDPLSKASAGTNIGRKRSVGDPSGRSMRDVWTMATVGYPGAHYATFPPELPQRCIRAGTSEKGVCPDCGAPWERVVERTTDVQESAKGSRFDRGKTAARDGGDRTQPGERFKAHTTGWRPTCTCYDDAYRAEFQRTHNQRKRYQQDAADSWFRRARKRPGDGAWRRDRAVVLDPFAGSGTAGVEAIFLGRRFLGFDLAGGDCDHGGFTPNDRLRAAEDGKRLNERWLVARSRDMAPQEFTEGGKKFTRRQRPLFEDIATHDS